jgi:lipopolysaccharide export system protein LptC
MYGRSAIWFPLALLALLAALTFWIDRAVQPPQPVRDGSTRHAPDYTVNNFSINKPDSEGNRRYTLAATEMKHFPDDDTTELLRPRFTQYSPRKPTMQIQSQRGRVSADGENVYFMDNVKLAREATPSKGELTVLTEYLHILPEQDIAATDRPVKILQAPSTVITANGMELNRKERTLKLFRHVRVHYARPGLFAGEAAPTTSATQQRRAAKVQSPKRGKPQTGKSKTITGEPQRRIRRHYETSTPR